MNKFDMVAFIVLVVMLAGIAREAIRYRGRRLAGRAGAEDSAETLRLRDEVRQLKERVQVLERITVEKENSLERQIEELRDR